MNMNVERSAYPGFNYRTVAVMHDEILKMGKRNAASRLLRAKNDRDTIVAWKQDLNRILHIFNVRFVSPA